MFDLGWSELLVIAVVAIIFVGPRELVPMLRSFGRFAAKMKSMANEFQSQFNDALRDAELDQVKKQVESAGSLSPMNALRKQLEDVPRSVEKAISDKQKSPEMATQSSDAKPAVAKPAKSAAKAGKRTPRKTADGKRPATKKTAARASAGKKTVARAPARKTAAAKPKRRPAKKGSGS